MHYKWLLNKLVSCVRAINDTGIVDVTMDVEWCCPSICYQSLTSQRSSPIPSFFQHSGHRPPRSEEGPGWHFVRWQRKHPAFCLPEESSPPFPDCPSCRINNRLYFTVNENNDEIDPERRPNWQASQYLKAVPCSVSSNFPGTLANRHTSSQRAAPCLFTTAMRSAGAMRWWSAGCCNTVSSHCLRKLSFFSTMFVILVV